MVRLLRGQARRRGGLGARGGLLARGHRRPRTEPKGLFSEKLRDAITVPPPFPEVPPSESPSVDPLDSLSTEADAAIPAAPTLSSVDMLPAPATAPEPIPEAPAGRSVVVVGDDEAQFELGRRMQVVHVGWMVNGTLTLGNHTEADMILPECRLTPEQTFEPVDYLSIRVRGRRGHLDVLSSSEMLIDGNEPGQARYESPESNVIEVIRRDENGDEDFVVRMQVVQDRKLPQPRARLLQIDQEDDLAAALLTRGLPTRQPRVLELGGMRLTFFYDDGLVTISNYLASYQRPGGFHPFFIQSGEGRFQTAPEDGADVALRTDDRFVIGHCVYQLHAD